MNKFVTFLFSRTKALCSGLLQKYRNMRCALYTSRMSRLLGGFGENSIISRPFYLEGGGGKRVSIGNHTCISHHSLIGCWVKYRENESFSPTIRIGDNCLIGAYCQISSIQNVVIGNGVLTGRFVYIGDNSHGGLSHEEANIPPQKRKLLSKGGITIGNNVWIGDKATILGGVTIGDNVIIGANSVVTHDVPSNSIAAGAPAQVIKHLD